MHKKIFKNMSILAILVALAASFLYSAYYYSFFRSQLKDEVKEKAIIISKGIEGTSDKYTYLKKLDLKGSSNRLTLIDHQGDVLFDSHLDESVLENHLTRPEVQEAIKTGSGEEVRESSTQLERIYYYALRLADGSILRLAMTTRSFQAIFYRALPYVFLFMASIMVLCVFIALGLTKKITRPINDININNQEFIPPYQELAPFYYKIEEQNTRINEQMRALKEQNSKIKLILSNTMEGIALIDGMGRVLSVNNSLLDIVGAPYEEYEGRSFLEVSRKSILNESLKAALQGKEGRGELTMGEKTYSFTLNPVYHEGIIAGAILLLVDVTEKYKAEIIRREFSANVSHELKTPLTSISGYAEMISTGMATFEDSKTFAAKIQKEASRLLEIITDIMKLSRLEEGKLQEDIKEVNLLKIINTSAERLSGAIAAKELTLELPLTEAYTFGNEGMLEELVFNLMENAIKYNKPQGKISVELEEDHHLVKLRVKDTGIGISFEDQERIFERFYRVDKSHSKKTGGTGLGLAIVKHIAEYHKGSIRVISEIGKGTTMEVTLRKEG
ncbi:sensor histidine kinase [Alloiococcus sp. CFN-8]|uniref:sensor histidine kinase n=1 Tax=Alloiococcus sp. CFN-8 TaxID=3416081 RepID=UPI003CF99477